MNQPVCLHSTCAFEQETADRSQQDAWHITRAGRNFYKTERLQCRNRQQNQLTEAGVMLSRSNSSGSGRIPDASCPLLYASPRELKTPLALVEGRNVLIPRAAPVLLWDSRRRPGDWSSSPSRAYPDSPDSRVCSRRRAGDPKEPLLLRLYAVTSVTLIQQGGTLTIVPRALL